MIMESSLPSYDDEFPEGVSHARLDAGGYKLIAITGPIEDV